MGDDLSRVTDGPPVPGRRRHLAFCLVLLVYLALLLPTLSRSGILWDEQTDLDISRSYLAGAGDWFHGSSRDGSQARLPMVAVALLFSLVGDGGLPEARGVSCLLGALTLLAVYSYGRIFLDSKRGLLACFLLATSPFFLSFARVALTESGLFFTCALSWFLVSASSLMRRRTAGACLGAAVFLGLSISAKFTAVALIPVGMLAVVLAGDGGKHPDSGPPSPGGAMVPLAGTAVLLLGIAECWWVIWRMESRLPGPIVPAIWTGLMALYLAIAAWQIRRRSARLSGGEAGPFVGGFAAATFMLLPPVHTTNPALLPELVRRLGHGPPRSLFLAFEHLVFHGGCVLFKSSPWIGAGILLSLVTALAGWRRRAEIRVPLIVVIVYFFVLIALPIAQTFYMVPLLPPLALLASDRFFRLRETRPRVAGAAIAAGFVLLGADLARCHPDYNLNGFQYLGARRLAGRSTVGYRGIVQVTTDGVQQALEWTLSRAGARKTVVTYVTAPHIVRSLCPNPVFRIEDGLTRPPEALWEADYAVIGIGAAIVDDWGPPPAHGEVYRASWDEAYLRENFRKVFTVRRAFGFEVASVWERQGGKSAGAEAREAPLPLGRAMAPEGSGPPPPLAARAGSPGGGSAGPADRCVMIRRRCGPPDRTLGPTT